ncbi:uncharacterized protein LOC120431774 [Culex pipiens pallens]|uniref:uncharacterized protein LOC120431774 n=1 Tax=Culex pipiens pallens TaxID=42434 RepID=UPI001952C6AD|nr:uncharacterized protein LOC120431774 [Culex pipiens pallens]
MAWRTTISTVPLTVLLIICISFPFRSDGAQKVTLQLERFEQIGGAHFVDSSQLRVRKFNRTAFVLNGTFALLTDIDGSYEGAVKVAYSTLGNNQFNEYPMKLARKRFCDMLVTEYVEYQFIWKNCTNMPYIEQETREFCPFPKGVYWVRDLIPDASFVPRVVPTGLWRMTWMLLLPGEQVAAQFAFYFRITKEF